MWLREVDQQAFRDLGELLLGKDRGVREAWGRLAFGQGRAWEGLVLSHGQDSMRSYTALGDHIPDDLTDYLKLNGFQASDTIVKVFTIVQELKSWSITPEA